MDYLKPNPALYHVPFRTDHFNGMPFRSLGTSGLRVPNVGLGTWKFGYHETGDGTRVDEKTAFQIFDKAIELGVTFWDTANRYNAASGNSERIIGKWLKNNPDQRRNVIIATKIFGGMDGITPNHNGSSRGNILDSVHACLQRLQLDYVDVLYFHGFDPLTPIEESLETIEDLVRQKTIRYFAVSNFTVGQLAEYKAIAERMSFRCRPIAVQNQFDILHGEYGVHQGVLQYAAEKGISYVPWSPMARGLLTDRYLDLTKVKSGDRLFDEGTIDQDINPSVMNTLHQLASLAHEWELELSQLTIAYMLTLPGMGPMIPSSSTVAQLESNASAGKAALTQEQITQVQAVVNSLPRRN